MGNKFHDEYTGHNNHGINSTPDTATTPDVSYADIAARDADTAFNTDENNVDKVVKVESPFGLFLLVDTAPTWMEISGNITADTLSEVLANGNTTGGEDIVVETGDVITLIDAPSAATDAANKNYVDNASVSGFTLNFNANNALFPDSDPAAADSRNSHPVLSFDDTTAESIVFNSTIPNSYDGEDISIDIDWVAETATTGGVTWGVEVERNAPGGNDIDSDSFDTQQTGNSDTNATSGVITRTTITLAQAEADDVAANDSFRLRTQRVVSDGGDDMTGDAQIVQLLLRV